MRVLIGGLLGLCLLVSTPNESQARGDARAAVQTTRGATAARVAPQPARMTAPRPAAAPSRALAAPARAMARQPVLSARGAPRQLAASGHARAPVLAPRGQAGRHAAVPARGRQFAAIPYGRPMAQAPSGYRQTAMASCTMRGNRRICTGGATRSVAFRWGSDLGSQSMSQSSCPDGTIATIAVGHTDVVRCVPL